VIAHEKVTLGIALYDRIYINQCVTLKLEVLLMTVKPIEPITLPPSQDIQREGNCLKEALWQWLNQEYLPEQINEKIASAACQIYIRQRMEGENDLGSLVIAMVTEMQAFDFRKSFYSEFAVANAMSDLILKSLGYDPCCGST
jgi:hypothetical protein